MSTRWSVLKSLVTDTITLFKTEEINQNWIAKVPFFTEVANQEDQYFSSVINSLFGVIQCLMYFAIKIPGLVLQSATDSDSDMVLLTDI